MRFLFIYVDKIYVLYYNYNVYPLVFMIKGIKMFRNLRIKKSAALLLTIATFFGAVYPVHAFGLLDSPRILNDRSVEESLENSLRQKLGSTVKAGSELSANDAAMRLY